jgi:hypothetical protein
VTPLKKFKRELSFSRAFLRAAVWNSITTAVQARQKLRKAFQSARELRSETGEQVLPTRGLEKSITMAFGTFANQ